MRTNTKKELIARRYSPAEPLILREPQSAERKTVEDWEQRRWEISDNDLDEETF